MSNFIGQIDRSSYSMDGHNRWVAANLLNSNPQGAFLGKMPEPPPNVSAAILPPLDRPDLVARLDAAEDRYKKAEEALRLERGRNEKLEERNARAWEAAEDLQRRLGSISPRLDLMGADLIKLRRAIGTQRFDEIVGE